MPEESEKIVVHPSTAESLLSVLTQAPTTVGSVGRSENTGRVGNRGLLE